MNTRKQLVTRQDRSGLVLLVAFALLLGLYPILRYRGLWGEIDTNAATWAIRAMFETGDLVPANRTVYPNGYTFQALAVFLMNVSGLSLPALQLFGSSLLIVLVVIPAWMLYRELLGTGKGATLATALLFIQPEFVFVISRGTHEKFTRIITVLSLYLLVRSLRLPPTAGRTTSMILCFYLCGYTIIALNNLLATSFILGMLLALAITVFVTTYDRQLRPLGGPTINRLISVVAVLLVLAFLFTFYFYQPARHQLDILETISERVAALVFGVESADEEASVVNPYAKWVFRAWINLPTYFLVSLANWVVLLSSAAIWSWQSLRWLWGRWRPDNHGTLLLWAFYGAFTFQAAGSVVVDISGAIDGNLQHRIFPSFVLLATPMLTWGLERWWPRRQPVARLATGALLVAVVALGILSTLKSTNEPLVSNKWQFYAPAEMQAVEWANNGLRDELVWLEFDERLTVAAAIRAGAVPAEIGYDQGDTAPWTRSLLISDVTRARAERLGAPLPVEADSLITYDNGQAQVYHLRPRTPYQR